jgi:hypothetical protein
MFGNVAAIALTNAPVTLSTPPNSGASWAGPYQAQSAVLRFSGVLSSDVTITIPATGFFIVENLCTGAHVVKLASSAPGNIICAPPGEAVHVYCDGVDMRYVNLDRISAPLSLTTSAVPAWITSCTVPPYLLADGSTFSAVTYPVLNGLLGGNRLPDLRGRGWANLNQGTARITTAGSGIDGNTILSVGGVEVTNLLIAQLPTVTPTGTVSLSGSPNQLWSGSLGMAFIPGVGGYFPSSFNNISASFVGDAFGSGANHQNMGPTTIGGITLIRAG